MAATFTVTGKAGAGITVTAAVFTNVTSFTIDTVNNILTMVQGSTVIPAISIASAATVTVTKSGSTWTVAIS